jgi:hypothetical protein
MLLACRSSICQLCLFLFQYLLVLTVVKWLTARMTGVRFKRRNFSAQLFNRLLLSIAFELGAG